MQCTPLVRLLMSQERINQLTAQLKGEALTAVPADTSVELVAARVAALQDDIDRETRASLVVGWLGFPGPDASD